MEIFKTSHEIHKPFFYAMTSLLLSMLKSIEVLKLNLEQTVDLSPSNN